jgi:5-methylcytosine-specific restriction enzyme subunit McrC
MHNNSTIQVFEYEFLEMKKKGFEYEHWVALDEYNEAHGGDFFRLTHDGVKFQQYVGVIQVGNITIEILPKIGKDAEPNATKDEWQGVLIDMLRECSWMKVHAHEKASLQLKYNSILEAYLELFIIECEQLIRQGLIKKYRSESSNCNALKGKLLFSQNIQKNLVHQERFYTRHQVYDRDNIYNQVLLKALKLIPLICHSPLLNDRVYNLLLAFPELEDIRVTEATFGRLIFDRKTSDYQEAIEIAAMLLLNYRPDISSGNNQVLAILFDMNDLWEEYIYRQLQRHILPGWHLEPQDEKHFWSSKRFRRKKHIKPDIVIKSANSVVILDTKWKLPEDDIPADNDLKQMFVYNEYWDGLTAVLFYPHAAPREKPLYFEGEFQTIPDLAKYQKQENGVLVPVTMHACGIMKMSVLDKEKKLDLGIGKRVNEYINSKIFNAAEPTK